MRVSILFNQNLFEGRYSLSDFKKKKKSEFRYCNVDLKDFKRFEISLYYFNLHITSIKFYITLK